MLVLFTGGGHQAVIVCEVAVYVKVQVVALLLHSALLLEVAHCLLEGVAAHLQFG